MSDPTTPAARDEQQALQRARALFQARRARYDACPQLERIGELAAALDCARQAIGELLKLAGVDDDYVDPLASEEDRFAWGEFRRALGAWDYQLEGAFDTLHGEFTVDVAAALGDVDDAEDEASNAEAAAADSPADAPTVRAATELPPHRGKPYWLS